LDPGTLLVNAAIAVTAGLVSAVATHFLSLRQFRATRLHDKRLEVISQLSGHLASVESTLQILTRKDGPRFGSHQSIMQGASSEIFTTRSLFINNSTFFSRELGSDIEKFLDTGTTICTDWYLSHQYPESNPDNFAFTGAFEEASQLAFGLLPKTREKIEMAFRRIVGTEEPRIWSKE
jgi:hypothetical protein